jgi:hypothetical protein
MRSLQVEPTGNRDATAPDVRVPVHTPTPDYRLVLSLLSLSFISSPTTIMDQALVNSTQPMPEDGEPYSYPTADHPGTGVVQLDPWYVLWRFDTTFPADW